MKYKAIIADTGNDQYVGYYKPTNSRRWIFFFAKEGAIIHIERGHSTEKVIKVIKNIKKDHPGITSYGFIGSEADDGVFNII